MTTILYLDKMVFRVSTHMPLARHDPSKGSISATDGVSTHMPLARHDLEVVLVEIHLLVSTHMPLARHDQTAKVVFGSG